MEITWELQSRIPGTKTWKVAGNLNKGEPDLGFLRRLKTENKALEFRIVEYRTEKVFHVQSSL